jgi:nitrogen regulatory protein P-II 1
MKEIRAYIHKHRIADVIQAIKTSRPCGTDDAPGCRALSVTAVKTLLRPVDEAEQHYSVDLAEPVIDEYRLELVCEDHEADTLAALIERTARTGQAEAGWILVTEVLAAIPIRGPRA